MQVRDYRPADERAWVRCRALAFLDTAYFDNVLRAKEHYERPAIELIAEDGGGIVGLLDAECEELPGTVCSNRPGLGAMMWHLAVAPDHRGRGIGTALLHAAERRARARGVERLEAWTRDDAWVCRWYEGRGFQAVESYLHVFIEGREASGAIGSAVPGLLPVSTFAHYVGADRDLVRQRFRRVHECVLYERRFGAL